MADVAETAGEVAHSVEDGSPQWRRTLFTMVAVQLIVTTAFSFLTPILPLFLPELGVTTPQAIDLWAGAVTSIATFVAAFAAPFWGHLADRLGRKLMVLRSSFAIAVCTALMGLSQNVWHLLGARALLGAFAGFASASVVLVASQVPERRLGYALGLLSTGQLVGQLLGPVLGGALADLTGSHRIPFFASGVTSLSAFVLCWWLVPESFTRPAEPKRKTSIFASMRVMTQISGLAALVLVLLLTQFGVQAIQPVVTLFVEELTGPRPDVATLGGLAFSATGLAGVVAVPLLGRASDRIGYRLVLLISLTGAVLFTVPQALVPGYWSFVALRFGVGLFVGGVLPAANALIGRLTPAEKRGFTFGMTSSAYMLGSALGPITGGAVGATLGLRYVFVVTAVLLLANLIWVWLAVPGRTGLERT
jgi:DHA1 family multidrug resistance protein-like MFS transporter